MRHDSREPGIRPGAAGRSADAVDSFDPVDPVDPAAAARRAAIGSGVLLVLVFLVAVAIGPLGWVPGWPLSAQGTFDAWSVLLEIRAPRAAAAALVGAALAGSGAALQTVFRNPLAAPDILGLSSGAALGAGSAIWFGATGWLIHLAAFGGALVAVALVGAFARAMRSAEPTPTLILCGIAIAALLSAALALLTSLADPARQLPAITYWLLGSLAGIGPRQLAAAAAPIVIGLVVLWAWRWRIDALWMPDDEARALGHEPRRLRLLAIAMAALVAAAAVALAGLIGWVGLLLPHAARLWCGAAFARMFPVACLGGATFLLIVDTASRSIAAVEVPPGVGTALIGVPLLLVLLARSGRAAGLR